MPPSAARKRPGRDREGKEIIGLDPEVQRVRSCAIELEPHEHYKDAARHGLLGNAGDALRFAHRAQGQRALGQMVDTVRQPGGALATAGDGVLVALAGILLILPGFLTDLVGLLLLVPPIRQAVLRRFADYARQHPGARW